MAWSDTMDLTMLREIAAGGVMQKKSKSRERGTAWQVVVNNLNPLPDFNVSVRSVRDRYYNIAKKYKLKMGKEKRATGGGGEEASEKEQLLEELMLIEEETEQRVENESEIKKKIMNKEREEALEMRRRALETMGETSQRLEEEPEPKKQRRSQSRAMSYMEEAIKAKQEMMKLERQERVKERETQMEFLQHMQFSHEKQNTARKVSEQHLLQQIQQQQQQHQQQSQQFALMQQQMMMIVEQQQKQTDLLMQLFKKNEH